MVTLLSGLGHSGLRTGLSKLIGRRLTAEEPAPNPLPAALHDDEKRQAIKSYAEFCDGGPDPAYPLEVFLELSNLCDLKCAMCVEFSALSPHRLNALKLKSRGFMEHGEVLPRMDEVLSHALLVHCFGYGEPTIHPDFREFLDHVSQFEVLIDFFSNGMHLDEDLCDFLASRRIYKITISFSGSTKDFYESVYLGGKFEQVLDGIQRLAEAKRRHASPYPIIEINSLGFKGHVETFDDFVQIMGERGVNTIFLKPLQGYRHIPQLYEHISIMRPEIEGPILERAREIGRRLGVHVHTDIYVNHVPGAEVERARAAIEQEAADALAEATRPYGQNPVTEFPALARELAKVKGTGTIRQAEEVLTLGLGPDISRAAMKVEMQGAADGEPPFHCMEPFKTMYVTRNGAIKPCCFANPAARHLGSTGAGEAVEAWRGDGYGAVRDGAGEGRYSETLCGPCIRNRTGPRGHFTGSMIQDYAVWHRRGYASALASDVAPLVERIHGASSETIMARRPERESPAVRREVAAVVADPERDWSLADGLPLPDLALPEEAASAIGLTSAPERAFLYGLARDHYSGEGLILDVGGLLGASAMALASGLRANPEAERIIARWRETGAAPIRVFERGHWPLHPSSAAHLLAEIPDGHGLTLESDLGAELQRRLEPWPDLVSVVLGDFPRYEWGPEKVEICFIDLGRGQSGVASLVAGAGQGFIPGKTLLVLKDFYHQLGWRSNVQAGLLADRLEWLGQLESCAIFRVAKALPPELHHFNLMRALSPRAVRRLQMAGDHPKLPLRRRVLLHISWVNLLAIQGAEAEARSYLQTIRSEFEAAAVTSADLRMVQQLCTSAERSLDRQLVQPRPAGAAELVA